MKSRFINSKSTVYVQLDTQKCVACWECQEICPHDVIGKVNMPWHKHAKFVKPDACTGCLNCVNTCQHSAFSLINRANYPTNKQQRKFINQFLLNNLLLIFGIFMIFSGLSLQIGYHMSGSNKQNGSGKSEYIQSMTYEQVNEIDTNRTVCGLNYQNWSTIHKFSIVFFSLLMIYHIYVHWKWYKRIISKHLVSKNIQVFTLSVLFILVTCTGLIPWFIQLSGGAVFSRFIMIEIHDKLALILVIFIILHIIKRKKWFTTVYKQNATQKGIKNK
jgi:2-oxoglutarate ferredoxin oxidoreductase subunit delta